jgi:hypothetical protein
MGFTCSYFPLVDEDASERSTDFDASARRKQEMNPVMGATDVMKTALPTDPNSSLMSIGSLPADPFADDPLDLTDVESLRMRQNKIDKMDQDLEKLEQDLKRRREELARQKKEITDRQH